MYKVGKRSRRNRRLIIAFVAFIVLAIGGGYGYKQYKNAVQPIITNTAGTTREVKNAEPKLTRFDEGGFEFYLPPDWKKVSRPSAQYTKYSYQSTMTNADNRQLDIYMDNLPLNLPVNQAVAVQANGNKLTYGNTSENCINFTSAEARKAGGSSALQVKARWDGVEFLCDLDNSTRNVIGTSSPQSINKVTLTTLEGKQRAFFFVYFDQNYNPDYSIFYKMLDSFVAK